jgi:hypothetical protein
MLERRREPELVPNYSLTGDLLSFMRCGLQYRYQNGSALPPSRPVQMWFGEFIHGAMEIAYRMWNVESPPAFPWPCTPTPFHGTAAPDREAHDIGAIGDLVEATLSAAGKNARSADVRESAYRRTERAVNELGPALFPLVTSAEEKVIGTRALPAGAQSSRAQMYELHGVMDVLSSMTVAAAGSNVICDAVHAAISSLPSNADLIVDYKGSARPATACADAGKDYWTQGDWQLQMYAWLRAQQPTAKPVIAGVLLYINELAPSSNMVVDLRRHVERGHTDVEPVSGSRDDYLLRTWRPGSSVPDFSLDFRLQRAIRVVPITPTSTANALAKFDGVVVDIERCVSREAQSGKIIAHWGAGGDESTCVACDFRHFCPSPALHRAEGGQYTPKAPRAPG